MLNRRGFLATAALAGAVRLTTAVRAMPVTARGKELLAVADGRQDATTVLSDAAQSVPDSGGLLLLPPGRYSISRTLHLKSGTVLEGDGATLVAAPSFATDARSSAQSTPSFALIANVAHTAEAVTDHDIQVLGLTLDMQSITRGNAHAVSFRKARNLVISRCIFRGGGNATALISCSGTEVSYCEAYGTLNCAYDHWGGTSNGVVHDCKANCAQGYGILFTGRGTLRGDDETATGLTARDNQISGTTTAGIWVCSLSAGSKVTNVDLNHNRIFSLRGGFGIGASGDVRDLLVEKNVVEGVNGPSAMFVRGDAYNRPRSARFIDNVIVNPVVSDRDIAPIQALCDNVEIRGNRVIGGKYPFLVWAEGQGGQLADNLGDSAQTRGKYLMGRSADMTLVDP